MTATNGHMRCHVCLGHLTDVNDSRAGGYDTGLKVIKSIRRRRFCPTCGDNKTTFEIPEADLNDMKDGMPEILRKNINNPELQALIGRLAMFGGLK